MRNDWVQDLFGEIELARLSNRLKVKDDTKKKNL